MSEAAKKRQSAESGGLSFVTGWRGWGLIRSGFPNRAATFNLQFLRLTGDVDMQGQGWRPRLALQAKNYQLVVLSVGMTK